MSLSTLLSGVATNTPVKVWLPVIGIRAVAIPDQIFPSAATDAALRTFLLDQSSLSGMAQEMD